MDNSKLHILILGTSGRLGHLIAEHLLTYQHLTVSIQARSADKIKDLVEAIEKSGGRVIIGALDNPEVVTDITKGVHTVISCIGTFGQNEVTLQTNVLNDAIKNGAKRFFASHFGINYDKAPRDNALINGKLDFNRILLERQANILPVIITCGVFYEFFLELHTKGLEYWGDIDQKIDMISYDDIARFTVAVALQPEKSGQFAFVGAQYSVREVVDIYNRVRGTNVGPKRLGSLEDLVKLAEEKKKEGGLEGTFLQLFSHIYGGKGLSPVIHNQELPEVKVTSLEQALKQNSDIKIA